MRGLVTSSAEVQGADNGQYRGYLILDMLRAINSLLDPGPGGPALLVGDDLHPDLDSVCR